MRDISYGTYRKSCDIHGTALYPAVMVAPVQKQILNDILARETTYSNVVDPFFGSGTALYECGELYSNIKLCGCDINPLAYLITMVKLRGVSPRISESINELKLWLKSGTEVERHNFAYINKWFRNDVIYDLSRLRYAITHVENEQDRKYFWYMMTNSIRKYSNTRSSTFKLHVKTNEQIEGMTNCIIEEFLTMIREKTYMFVGVANNINIAKCDALTYLSKKTDNEFDICITSPPYGDNATTVTYGQFSILALQWIDRKDLALEGWEFENYSKIDSKSLGGPYQNIQSRGHLAGLERYTENMSKEKRRKIERYFNGYYQVLEQICRVTRGYIIMTLGNRTVDAQEIDLVEMTERYALERGFVTEEICKRAIVSKRMPTKVSKVKDASVSSMNEEYILVMKKH